MYFRIPLWLQGHVHLPGGNIIQNIIWVFLFTIVGFELSFSVQDRDCHYVGQLDNLQFLMEIKQGFRSEGKWRRKEREEIRVREGDIICCSKLSIKDYDNEML